MLERLQNVVVSKVVVLAAVVSLTLMPWFQCGRDPVGWMVLWGVALLGSYILWRSDAELVASKLGLAWLLFVAWAGLSSFWSVNRYQSFTTFLLYAVLGIIFILVSGVKTNRQARQVLVGAYILFGVIAAAVGLLFYIVNPYNRATSTLYLPNPFAGFLLSLVILGLWRFAHSKRLLDGLLAVFSLSVFVLTDSRGAFLALVVALVVGAWLAPKVLKSWRQLAMVVVGAVVLVLLASLIRSHFSHSFTLQGARFRDIASTDSSSTSDRVYYLKSALLIWEKHPLAGSGAGTFSTLHPKYQYRVISAGNNVHNFYVQTLSELGVVGFGVLIYVLVLLISGVLRGVKEDPTRLPLALGLLAVLLHSAVDIDANYPVLWSVVVVLAALCYTPKPSPRRKLVSPAIVAIGGTLILALPIIWLFQNQTKAQKAATLESTGDYVRAVSYYQSAHLHPPYDPDWLNAEGINDYVLASKGVDAQANLSQALALGEEDNQLDPDDGQHDLLRGRVLLLENKLDQAKAADLSAIGKDPYDHPDYYNDLAAVYVRENNLPAAKATVDKVVALYTPAVISNRNSDPTVATSLATTYATAAEVAALQGNLTLARADIARSLGFDQTNAAAQLLAKQIGPN